MLKRTATEAFQYKLQEKDDGNEGKNARVKETEIRTYINEPRL